MAALRTVALPMLAILAIASVSSSCGGERQRADDEELRTSERKITELSEGRLVVAEVNGEPIYDSCVINQATAHNLSRAEAVNQCIDFALLAQEAVTRGYADHPAVVDTHKTETVRALIDGDFVASFATPEDIPEEYLREHWKAWETRLYNVPELRSVEYLRIKVDDKIKRGASEDLAALAVAKTIHSALADKRNLEAAEFKSIAVEAAAGSALEMSDKPYRFQRRGQAVEAFAKAGFAIAEVGMVSPPTRTRWGWDILLLTRIEPERSNTFASALPEMRKRIFAMSRQRSFAGWVAKHTGKPEFDDYWLERLAAAERAQTLMLGGDPTP